VGGPADREHRGPEPRDHRRRRPGTPRDGYQSCGSRTPTSTRPRVSGSTSTSGYRPRWPSSGSPPPSPRVGSSTTARRRRTP
jgi:hypothetical protein